jgi:sulfide:quinone oxidoreductase
VATEGWVKHRVVIVGGGVAALEAALALHELAPDRTLCTVIAPNAEYVVRAQTVREPFAFPEADRHAVAPIVEAAGAKLLVDSLARVDSEARVVITAGGEQLAYDSLVLALGAAPRVRYEHALTVNSPTIQQVLQDVLAAVDAGKIRDIAFITPTGPSWPLPNYELAYMTARRARERGIQLNTTLITPEDQPFSLFGGHASHELSKLLIDGGVEVMTSSEAEVPSAHEVLISPGQRRLRVDRVLALPELLGPNLPGVPADEYGFVPVDEHGRVAGAPGVFAVGDITSHRIKHGGFSAQQADAAAEVIAAAAGVEIDPQPVDRVLRGMFITGGDPIYVSVRFEDGHASDSVVTSEPTVDPGHKISARYLSAYLDRAAA